MLSPEISTLLEKLQNQHSQSPLSRSDEASIKVSRITSRAGAFYEKIRYFVDYKEEHTIRRSAIERILKRRVMIESDNNIGLTFIEELVRGGYLPNDRISESVSRDVQKILNRFLLVKEFIGPKLLGNLKLKSRLINLAASEIDLFLYPTPVDDLVANTFYESVKDSIQYSGPLSRDAFLTQLYIACRRTLLKNDDSTIFYALWLRAIPEWPALLTRADIQNSGHDFFALLQKNTAFLEDEIRWPLQAKLRNQAIYFSVLKEIIDHYGSETQRVLNDQSYLDQEVSGILKKKYAKENGRVKKSAKRAIVYVFCTKIILAFVIELPYEILWAHFVNYTALTINVLFHPFILFLITKNIKPLDEKNSQKIMKGLHGVVYGPAPKKISIHPSKNSSLLTLVFTLLYGVIFLISFGIIIWVLVFLQFNIVGMLLFLLFLTFVSYFGLRIRYTAQNWRIRDDEEHTLALIWNVFTLPIVRMGRWLSTKFQSVNIFVFVMDFLIEVPFKLILATSDGFLSFLKEKRDETY